MNICHESESKLVVTAQSQDYILWISCMVFLHAVSVSA